jgi:hypothetical protein
MAGRVCTNEADTHDIGRANVGVAELLEAGHQAGQARPHIRRTRRADHLKKKYLIQVTVFLWRLPRHCLCGPFIEF